MAKDVEVRGAHVDAALEKTSEAADPLCELALDVLGRQAEGHLLYAGASLVETRAKAAGVDADDASVAGHDVVALLSEGPTDAAQFALIGALAVRGLDLSDDDSIRKFVRHATWLELATPYAPLLTAAALLGDEEDAARLWDALTPESTGDTPRATAIAALHREVLRRAGRSDRGEDSNASEDGSSVPAGVRIEGSLQPPPRSGFRGFLRLVSGWALLTWVLRGLGALVGMRRRGVLSMVDGGVKLDHQVEMFGRPVREGTRTMTLSAIAHAGRTTRFPAIHLLVGAVALALGVIVGGTAFVEGLRSGETILLLAGAGLVLLGGGLDLGLTVLWPAKQGRVSVNVSTRPGRSAVLSGVDEDAANAFLDALARRLPK